MTDRTELNDMELVEGGSFFGKLGNLMVNTVMLPLTVIPTGMFAACESIDNIFRDKADYSMTKQWVKVLENTAKDMTGSIVDHAEPLRHS